MKKIHLIVIIHLLFIGSSVQAQIWDQFNKVLPNPFPDNYFGRSVSISGDYAVVGATEYKENTGCAYVLYFNGNEWENVAQLIVPDGAKNDNFGVSVSISGNYIVIGANQDDDVAIDCGSAYVFAKPSGGWSDMTPTAKLSASDGDFAHNFGCSVSISGDNIIIGANFANFHGCGYVYTKTGDEWTSMNETAKLTPDDGEAFGSGMKFGTSVSISNDNIVIGADVNENKGAAYVFTKPLAGWADMTQTAKLTADDRTDGDFFGISVNISGNDIIIGAPGHDELYNLSGAAYVFTKPVTGWTDMTQSAKLTPDDAAENDWFGINVSISDDDIVIGTQRFTDGGSVYIFTKPSEGWENMTQTAKLTDNEANDLDFFGRCVSISGNYILIGADGVDNSVLNSGSVYIYTKPNEGWNNTSEYVKIPSPNINNHYNLFGSSVSLSGNVAVIGSKGHLNNRGCADIYYFNGNSWEHKANITASDGEEGDYFGSAVSISGDNIVIGAPLDDINGSAYVYKKPVEGWSDMTQTAKLTVNDTGEDYRFGTSVSISEDIIVIGAPGIFGSTNLNGEVYVFSKPTEGWTDMTQTAKLVASDGSVNDYFGYSVCISGDYIVAGAYGDDDETIIDKGAAYVFTKPTLGWSDMTQTAKLTANDGAVGDCFGVSVGIEGDNIVAGASKKRNESGYQIGSAYVFTKPETGWSDMTQTAALSALNEEGFIFAFFGSSVSISGSNIIIGEFKNAPTGSGGLAYIFSKPDEGWIDMTETQKLHASDSSKNDHFGMSVCISGNIAIIGADEDDDLGTSSGSAYFFHLQSAQKINTANDIQVHTYPNPTKDFLTLIYDNPIQVLDVLVCDITGKIVCKPYFENYDNQIKINMSKYKSGIYILHIKTKEEVITQKIIKN